MLLIILLGSFMIDDVSSEEVFIEDVIEPNNIIYSGDLGVCIY